MVFRSRAGQSLMELLVGIAVGAIFVVGAATIIAPSLQVNKQAGTVQEEAQLGQQMLNNIQAWSNGNWGGVLALATGTANRYYLNTNASPFMAVGSAYAGDFNGTDDYVSTANATTGPMVYSISAWFNTTTANGGRLVGFGNAQTGLSGHYDRHIYMMNDGQLVFGNYNGSGQIVTSPLSYNDGSWHDVVATLSSAGQYLYVDGALVASSTNTVAQAYTGYWRIGYDSLNGWPNAPSSYYFAGLISNVRIYSTALTAAQASSIYAGSPPSSGLVGYWDFNQDVNDQSGFGNDGTWNGAAANGGSFYLSYVGGPAGSSGGQAVSVCSGGASSSNCTTFDRYFYLSDVYRDANGNATMTATGNYYDPSTKLATVVVGIASSTQPPIVYSEYITRTGNNTLTQGTWIGGSGAAGPLALVTSTYSSATSVQVTASGTLQLTTGSAAGGACYTTVSSILGNWPLDEGSGTTANDISGNGYTGTWNGADAGGTGDYTAGNGQAYAGYFNGTDDAVAIGGPLNLGLSFGTITAWIKTSNAGSSYSGIVVKQGDYGMFLNNNVFGLYDWGSNNWRSTGVNLADGKWHFVACAFQSGVTGGTTCYVDGVAEASTTMTVSSQGTQAYIGYGNASGQYFTGAIQDVLIYNRALSPSDIQTLYSGGTVN